MGKAKNCCFCNSATDDELTLGRMYTIGNITTHYFCLLLSTNTRQHGEDHEGILGFLLSDIRAEVKKIRRVFCAYCKKRGASIKCSYPKCRTVFHLPCGLKKSTHHHFFDAFQSFCDRHRPVQKVPTAVKKTATVCVTCAVCYESLSPKPGPQTIWFPCCKAWFHKECLQRLALSAGYFFKCPLCNNKDLFEKTAKQCGVFVPERDASWELVPNAYGELLERHSLCDARLCRARARDVNLKGQGWEIILCKYCGSQGIHRICGNLKSKRATWQCHVCMPVAAGESDDDENEDTPAIAEDSTPPVVQEQDVPQSSETPAVESESSTITYNIITDVEENISVVLSSSDSDVEVVNYEPSIRSVDSHKYELKTRSGNYLEVVKLNEPVDSKPVVDGDLNVRRRKKVIQIDEDSSDVAVFSEPESEYGD